MDTRYQTGERGSVKPNLGESLRLGRECLSDLQIDQIALGELDGVTSERARLHLGQCSSCAEAFQTMAADRREFDQLVNVPQMAARILAASTPSAKRWHRWLRSIAWPAGMFVAAAAGLVFLAQPLKTNFGSTERAKGSSFTLSTYVKFVGQDPAGTFYLGQPLHEGDRVQFEVSTAAAGHLAILSIDGANEVSVFYPVGEKTAAFAVGKDLSLGNAVELDGVQGQETVVALLCETERSVAELVSAARTVVAGTKPGAAFGPLHTGCVESRTILTKANGAAP